MKKTNFELWREAKMKNPKIAAEYDALAPRYEIIKQVIDERNKQKMTQEEFAQRIGVHQSSIARFESGNYNPSLEFLHKVATGMGKKVSVKFG
jgi:DNA-binding XRE family transcriptional regulator